MTSLEFINQEIERTQVLLGLVKYDRYIDCYKILSNQLKQLQEVKYDLESYQNLKDKTTPKKPVERKETDIVVGEYTAYDCPCCKQEQVMIFPDRRIVGVKRKYCGECATALDWRKE